MFDNLGIGTKVLILHEDNYGDKMETKGRVVSNRNDLVTIRNKEGTLLSFYDWEVEEVSKTK
ncbi:hypothetical protein KM915_21060 [Cytobacillus oceanisediminis]|uniref:hypothetical protein n=1 Tax=Cytobacillus oceanisediminis TaxID=665099 RepID=UPI001C243C74|nr:hypothetical protein [Cytobacillus oceanisediminis]MBU8732542.1 hypothetical protein [Cytobacillus oceanisediminis]